jgi:hypothetical protein
MASPLRLHVVSVGSTRIPRLDALVDGIPLELWFSQATGNKLQIHVQQHPPISGPEICNGADLNRILRLTLGDSNTRPVEDIALIFCGWWARSTGLLGVMFDYDGTDERLGSFASDGGIPREGCAVFVNAVGQANLKKQIFTAIHELGHVFNLQHDDTENSFMATNRDDIFQFNDQDCEHLVAAARGNFFYAPGGANFGDSASPALFSSGKTQKTKRCTLEVRLGKLAYLMGEPVVLDLELKPKSDVPVFVPNTLDPGYRDFNIWIQNELGERYLHRPPHVFCLTVKDTIEVSSKRPLKNNPRIFIKSPGPNFDKPGIYQLWAEFQWRRNKTTSLIRSNTVGLEVLAPSSLIEEKISAAFRQPQIALFLSNKGGTLRLQLRRLLYSLIKEVPRHHALQYSRYALGMERLASHDYDKARELLTGARPKELSIRKGITLARRQLDKIVKGHKTRRQPVVVAHTSRLDRTYKW